MDTEVRRTGRKNSTLGYLVICQRTELISVFIQVNVCKLNLNHFCWILRLFVLYSNAAKDVDKMQYFIFLSFFPKLDLRSPLALWLKVHLGVNEDDVSIFLY